MLHKETVKSKIQPLLTFYFLIYQKTFEKQSLEISRN